MHSQTNSTSNRRHGPSMSLSDRLDLYREQYYFELERKDRLTSRLSFPSGIVTVLAGALGYFLTLSEQAPPGFVGVLFAYMVTAMAMALASTVFCLMMAYRDHRYGYLPNAQEVEKYWNALAQHYKETTDGAKTSEERFSEALVTWYCQAHARTAESNKVRTHWRTMANRSLLLTIVLASAVSFLSRWSDVSRLATMIHHFWWSVVCRHSLKGR